MCTMNLQVNLNAHGNEGCHWFIQRNEKAQKVIVTMAMTQSSNAVVWCEASRVLQHLPKTTPSPSGYTRAARRRSSLTQDLASSHRTTIKKLFTSSVIIKEQLQRCSLYLWARPHTFHAPPRVLFSALAPTASSSHATRAFVSTWTENRSGGGGESLAGEENGWGSELTGGHPQQQGPDQYNWAGGQGPCTVAVVIPMAVAPVGPVAVVAKTTLHFGSRAAATRLVTEGLVRARLHHGVWKISRRQLCESQTASF